MNPMPAYKELFKQDIVRNIQKKTVDYRRNIYLPDLIDEAIFYAADMCLEFYVKSGHILPQNWIDHIVKETCAAFKDLFKEFDNAVIGNEKYIIFGKMEYIRISNNDASFSVTRVHRFR